MSISPYDYQIVDDAPTRDDRLTDLSVIGVPLPFQDQPPCVEAYPTRFSADAADVWTKMLESPEYRERTRGHSLDGAWHSAIMLFLEMCIDYGVSPFSEDSGSVKNEYVASAIRSARIRLVKYLHKIELFQKLRVRAAYREYIRTEDGFIVHSWADMFPYMAEDRHSFETWLLHTPADNGPRLLRYIDNHFVKVISPTLQLYVKCFNMKRIQVGFTIVISGSVNVPGNPTPTRKEVDAFMDEQILIPILRSHRLTDVTQRLF